MRSRRRGCLAASGWPLARARPGSTAGWRRAIASLASPRFQRWAAASRSRGRSRAGAPAALFDLCAGFVYAQVLHACVRLDLFEILAEGPRPSADARRPPRPAARMPPERLLRAAASLALVDAPPRRALRARRPRRSAARQPGRRRDGRAPRACSTPTCAIRWRSCAARPARPGSRGYWPYAAARRARGAGSRSRSPPTAALMAASQALVAEDVLDAYPLGAAPLPARCRRRRGRFLDAAAAARTASAPDAVRPAGGRRARARPLRRGRARDRAHGGRRQLPRPTRCRRARTWSRWSAWSTTTTTTRRWPSCGRARGAAAPGGTLLIAEPMAGDARAEPIGDAYFGFYLLAMGSGRARTPDELGAPAARRRLRRAIRRCRPAAAPDPPASSPEHDEHER